jgi:hypothetical protein
MLAFDVSHNGRESVHTIWALKDFLSLLEKYSSCEKGVLEIIAAAAGSETPARHAV